MREELYKSFDLIDSMLSKHFSTDNDERHGQPWNWNIGNNHDELGDEQAPHGKRVGTRRMATTLRALARKRGKSNIPKWTKLMELSAEQLNALGEKEFGSEWKNAVEAVAGGTANNMNVRDVPDNALTTQQDGPVNPEASKARDLLKEMARRQNLSVKDIEALSDNEVLRIARQLG